MDIIGTAAFTIKGDVFAIRRVQVLLHPTGGSPKGLCFACFEIENKKLERSLLNVSGEWFSERECQICRLGTTGGAS